MYKHIFEYCLIFINKIPLIINYHYPFLGKSDVINTFEFKASTLIEFLHHLCHFLDILLKGRINYFLIKKFSRDFDEIDLNSLQAYEIHFNLHIISQ